MVDIHLEFKFKSQEKNKASQSCYPSKCSPILKLKTKQNKKLHLRIWRNNDLSSTIQIYLVYNERKNKSWYLPGIEYYATIKNKFMKTNDGKYLLKL